MALTRTAQELQQLKARLAKISNGGDVANSTEEIETLLGVLEQQSLTPELIQSSGLGPVVRGIFNKLEPSSVTQTKAAQLLKSWKDTIDAAKAKSATHGEKKDEEKRSKVEPASFVIKLPSASSANPTDVPAVHNLASLSNQKASLSGERRPAFISIKDALSISKLDTVKAEFLAIQIEDALHTKLSGKQYSAKVRTLAFNLKKNEVLRDNVINGDITAERLVSMTPAELASQEVKEARESILHESTDAHQLDWIQEHKLEIQKELGLDPSNAWDFENDDDRLSEPDIEAPDM